MDVEDSDSEEEADVEIQVPENKIKLMVGAGGEKIKWIQRKSKARVQVSNQPSSNICLVRCCVGTSLAS